MKNYKESESYRVFKQSYSEVINLSSLHNLIHLLIENGYSVDNAQKISYKFDDDITEIYQRIDKLLEDISKEKHEH